MVSKKLYIESEHFNDSFSENIKIVDGGSRGPLFSPFNNLKTKLDIYAFEPDVEAKKEEGGSFQNKFFISKGLWSDEGKTNLHLASTPSTSSVYPPNFDILKFFSKKIGIPPRTTKEIVEIPTTSIDRSVNSKIIDSPHFIKLDVHSSEFEILLGSENSIDKSVMGIMVETWHHPIHKGQHLHGEIETFLNNKGFFIFNFDPRSEWQMYNSNYTTNKDEREVLIGSESVFLRHPESIETFSYELQLLSVAFAQLFGFGNYSCHICDHLFDKKLIDKKNYKIIIDLLNQNSSNTFGFKLKSYMSRLYSAVRGKKIKNKKFYK